MTETPKKWCVTTPGDSSAHTIAEVGFERKFVENPEVVCGRKMVYVGYPMFMVPTCADCLSGKLAAGEPSTVPPSETPVEGSGAPA